MGQACEQLLFCQKEYEHRKGITPFLLTRKGTEFLNIPFLVKGKGTAFLIIPILLKGIGT